MENMEQICYVVYNSDNVATAMADIKAGDVKVTGSVTLETDRIIAHQPVPFGHKIALRNMEEGEKIIKYGVPIGVVTKKIAKGMHVHLHNMKSAYDFRSAELDPLTVHAKDIEYRIY